MTCARAQLLRGHRAQAVFEILLLAVDPVVQFLNTVCERLVFAGQVANRVFQIAHLVVEAADGVVLVLLVLQARVLFLVALAEQAGDAHKGGAVAARFDITGHRGTRAAGADRACHRDEQAQHDGARAQHTQSSLGHAAPPLRKAIHLRRLSPK